MAEDEATTEARQATEAMPETAPVAMPETATWQVDDEPAVAETVPEAMPEATGRAHDEPVVPEEFVTFMSRSWDTHLDPAVEVDAVSPYTRSRRIAVGKRFPGETLVVPSGGLKVRANDTDYAFRPGSDFFWLTGCHEADTVLVIRCGSSEHDTQTRATLFVPDRSDRSTPAFFRDARYGELWVGPRLGVHETQRALGIECRAVTELPEALGALDPSKTRVLRGLDSGVDDMVPPAGDDPGQRDVDLAARLSEMRLIKDDYEIARLREAVAATITGFEECVREIPRAMVERRGERWLEGTFWRQARLAGNDVGYGSIVACGRHAATIHWMRNDGTVRDSDLLLLDMGVESSSLYTADVTRTLPVNGRFTKLQRQLYDIVHEAQLAGIAAVKPGAEFRDPHRAAMHVIAGALDELGILEGRQADAAEGGPGLYRRYTLHGTSHMLGLDVHDCSAARDERYFHGTLEPGMVLTVEPGLYFQPDDLTVPEELRGVGIRIEDDVLVTEDGCDVLSSVLPTQADEIETWMARLQTQAS